MINQNETKLDDKDVESIELYMNHPRLQRFAQALYNTVFEPFNRVMTWLATALGPTLPKE
jgi:hypothetical protein